MKDLREDEKAYNAFVENQDYQPYLNKIKDELNARMSQPVETITPFIPGVFGLAGYTKLDKSFYPVLDQYLDVCIERCENLEDSHQIEIELWRLMKFIYQLEALHVEIDGQSLATVLGAKVITHLLGYLWYDYCDEKENQETAE